MVVLVDWLVAGSNVVGRLELLVVASTLAVVVAMGMGMGMVTPRLVMSSQSGLMRVSPQISSRD